MAEFKNVGDAVKMYVAYRDELREWKRAMDVEEAKRKEELEKIEVWLLSKADDMGVDSFKTEFGTAYKSKSEHFRVGDWAAVCDYVRKTDNFTIFEKRIAKLATKEIIEVDGAIPDGVEYSSEFVMRVMRPGKKGGDKD